MTDAAATSDSSGWFERASGDLSLLTGYAVVTCSIYLWAYWTSFRVNIFEYLSIVDVVKGVAFPLGIAMAAFVIGALVSHLTRGEHLAYGGGRDTPIGRWLRAHMRMLGVFWMASLWLIYFTRWPYQWLAVGALVSPVISIVVMEQGAFQKLIPSLEARSTFVFLLASAPFWAFGSGQQKAEAVRSGAAFDFVVPGSEAALAMPARRPKTYLRYVGHAAEVIFLWNPSNDAVIITKLDAKEPVVLLSCPSTPRCAEAANPLVQPSPMKVPATTVSAASAPVLGSSPPVSAASLPKAQSK